MIGDIVWYPSDIHTYDIGKIVSVNGDNVQIEGQNHVKSVDLDSVKPNNDTIRGLGGSGKMIPKQLLHPVDDSHLQELDDLCNMNNLHEAPLLDVVRRRLFRNKIYTYTGDILLSLNPYETIEGLYDYPMKYYNVGNIKEDAKQFAADIMNKLPPHIYKLSNDALKQLINNGTDSEYSKINQSVIVSGESGSGKTEASKYVINFLIQANEVSVLADSKNSASTESATFTSVIKSILVESSTILEAFGNSKTVRNDNSSRFGKYIRLEYSDNNQIISAFTETFLLEKSRIVIVNADERNYHVFYQLLRGLSSYNPSLQAQLKLDDIDNFTILTAGKCTVIKSIDDDAKDFMQLVHALGTLSKFTTEKMNNLFSILAAILHIGNIRCESDPNDGNNRPKVVSSTMSLQDISTLLGVDELSFVASITSHRIKITGSSRKSIHVKILTPTESQNAVYAMIKWIYNKIFDYLVSQINHSFINNATSIGKQIDKTKFIGILDIFGFEILQSNSLEQLCINYTNERLQQQFNDHVFISEQIDYQREGINWNSVSYKDNQGVIDLIGKKPSGILCVLEEHGVVMVGNRKPDDKNFVRGLNSFHAPDHIDPPAGPLSQQHPNYIKSKFSDGFTIRHYAGEVFYNIDGFLSKNNDSLQEDILETLKSSSNSYFTEFILGQGGNRASAHDSKKMASAVTVSFQFRYQLDELITVLRSTHPHYIKCIKPNGKKRPFSFTSHIVMEQLRYSGALEVVRIRREGYPVRMSFLEFLLKNNLLAKQTGFSIDNVVSYAEDTMREMAQKTACLCMTETIDFQVGRNLIFLKPSGISAMDSATYQVYRRNTILIQSFIRGQASRKSYLKKLVCVGLLQRNVRMAMNKHKYKIKLDAVRIIQYNFRVLRQWWGILRALKSIVLNYHKYVTLEIQRVYRGSRGRKNYAQLKQLKYGAVTTINSATRMYLQRRLYKQSLEYITLLQALARRLLVKRSLSISHAQAIRIQSGVRMHQAINTKRLKLQALLKLQSYFRMLNTRYRFRHLVQSIVDKRKKKEAEIKAAKSKLVEESSTKIQTRYRTHVAQQKYAKSVAAIIKLQRWQLLLRDKSAYKRIKGASAVIKNKYLSYKTRNIYLETKQNKLNYYAIIIQKYVRRFLKELELARSMIALYHKRIESCLKIQCAIRQKMARNRVKTINYAVLLLQGFTRMVSRRHHYRNELISAITIQSVIRRKLAALNMKKSHNSAMKLQAAVRGMHARRIKQKVSLGIQLFQAVCRGRLIRHGLMKSHYAANMIQSNYRRLLSQRELLKVKETVSLIGQNCYRQLRKLMLKKQVLAVHLACKLANIGTITEALSKFHMKDGRKIHHHWDNYITIFHTLIASERLTPDIITQLEFTPMEVLQVDKFKNSLLHYAANNNPLIDCSNIVTIGRVLDKTTSSSSRNNDSTWGDDIDDDSNNKDGVDSSASSTGDINIDRIRETMTHYAATRFRVGNENSIHSDHKNSLISGWIQKRRDNGRWKKRFAVLSSSEITYYSSSNDLSSVRGTVPIQGCKIQRIENSLRIEVLAPNIKEKKTFFGRVKKQSMEFLLETEQELQHWLVPLKAVAYGVGTFRNDLTIPVQFANLNMKREWVSMINSQMQTALHRLAMNHSHNDEHNELVHGNSKISACPFASYLLEHGCPVDAVDQLNRTALHYAIEYGNFELALLLVKRGANVNLPFPSGRGTPSSSWIISNTELPLHFIMINYKGVDEPVLRKLKETIARSEREITSFKANFPTNQLLPSPPLVGEYCLLSLFFGAHHLPQRVNMTTDDMNSYPYLSISIYDKKKQLVESVQDVIEPALASFEDQLIWWGRYFHMQAPLQNIDDSTFVIIKYNTYDTSVNKASDVVVVESKPSVDIAWALLHLDKDIIDSGALQLETYTAPFSLNSVVISPSTGDVTVVDSLRADGVINMELQITTEQKSLVSMSKINA